MTQVECTHRSEDNLQGRLLVIRSAAIPENLVWWHAGNLQECSVLWGAGRMVRARAFPDKKAA